jgi:hypothetical protein
MGDGGTKYLSNKKLLINEISNVNRLRSVLEQKQAQERAEREAQEKVEQQRAAAKQALMKEQTASVDLLDICKKFVSEALLKIRAAYYRGQVVPDTDNIDLAVERAAIKALSENTTVAISLGREDFSYLTPLRDQLSLAFNRANIAMTRPPEKRSKETRRGTYDDYRETYNQRPLNDEETRAIYNDLLVCAGLTLKSIDDVLQGQMHSKKRFTPQIPAPAAAPK